MTPEKRTELKEKLHARAPDMRGNLNEAQQAYERYLKMSREDGEFPKFVSHLSLPVSDHPKKVRNPFKRRKKRRHSRPRQQGVRPNIFGAAPVFPPPVVPAPVHVVVQPMPQDYVLTPFGKAEAGVAVTWFVLDAVFGPKRRR